MCLIPALGQGVCGKEDTMRARDEVSLYNNDSSCLWHTHPPMVHFVSERLQIGIFKTLHLLVSA